MWLCTPGSCLSICVCDWHVTISAFVHLCFYVVMGECYLHCFLSIWLHAVEGRVCVHECVLRMCVSACLKEEWGRRGVLAAQASPSVSPPPLAPSALAEVVTRRQTAKRQTAAPRETRTL